MLKVLSTLMDKPGKNSVHISMEHLYSYYVRRGMDVRLPEHIAFALLSSVSGSESAYDSMSDYYWAGVAHRFLQENPNRALELLSSILKREGRFSPIGSSQGLSKIADEIVKEYPKESWNVISKELESDTTKKYEILQWLGDSGLERRGRKPPITLIPVDCILDWIEKDRENRLHLVLSMLPQTLDTTEGGQLTRRMIEKYADDESVSYSIISHFYAGSWSGLTSLHYSRKRDAARSWLAETDSASIQKWLTKFIDSLSDSIESEKIQEEREF